MVYINCVVFVTYKHLCFLPANLLYYYFIVISRDNTLMILASKCRKCKHAKSGAITLMCIKTNQKASKVSNEHLIIYLCFFKDTGIGLLLHTTKQIHTNTK